MTSIYISACATFLDLMAETMDELIGFFMAGKLSINIGKIMPLSQAAKALRLLENAPMTGKVVLKPWDDV